VTRAAGSLEVAVFLASLLLTFLLPDPRGAAERATATVATGA
jgi:hypothetical protein